TLMYQEAFEELKEKLITAPVLAYLNFLKPFILFTDASDLALSTILSQLDNDEKERLITYAKSLLGKLTESYLQAKNNIMKTQDKQKA
ncbi:8552_t:CDS:2, partial [Racocetra persica]